MSERTKIVEYARKADCLVVEDDYDSEFRYASQPVLSIQGLDGGSNVIYIGTFSRLLLPSIRISFMVLPQRLSRQYIERANLYNQTASIAEQIALCQYITDGHLLSRIKRQKKIYAAKSPAGPLPIIITSYIIFSFLLIIYAWLHYMLLVVLNIF